jgi:hypothetical protein
MKSFKHLILCIFIFSSDSFLFPQKISVRPPAPKVSIAQKCRTRPSQPIQPKGLPTPAQRTQIIAAIQPQPMLLQRAFSAEKRYKGNLGFGWMKNQIQNYLSPQKKIDPDTEKLLKTYVAFEQKGVSGTFNEEDLQELKKLKLLDKPIPLPAQYDYRSYLILPRHVPAIKLNLEDVNRTTEVIETNITLLKTAIDSLDEKGVKMLLDMGADPNANPQVPTFSEGYFNAFSHSPFIMAILRNQPGIALMLLLNGVRIEQLPKKSVFEEPITVVDYAKQQLKDQKRKLAITDRESFLYELRLHTISEWETLISFLEGRGNTPYDVD